MSESNSPERVRAVLDEFKPLRRLLIVLCIGGILAMLMGINILFQTGAVPLPLLLLGAVSCALNLYLAVAYRKAVAEAIADRHWHCPSLVKTPPSADGDA